MGRFDGWIRRQLTIVTQLSFKFGPDQWPPHPPAGGPTPLMVWHSYTKSLPHRDPLAPMLQYGLQRIVGDPNDIGCMVVVGMAVPSAACEGAVTIHGLVYSPLHDETIHKESHIIPAKLSRYYSVEMMTGRFLCALPLQMLCRLPR